MALKSIVKHKPYILLWRGAKESDFAKLYDSAQYQKGNGIYADLLEAHVTSIASFTDGQVKSCLLGNGTLQTDDLLIRKADSTINDAKGVLYVVTMDNGQSARIYIPMVKTTSIDALASVIGKLPFKTEEGAVLKGVTVDYKTTVAIAQA